MYLKQIELENFKSFGGKMTIPLMEGYLAVTGPNGSGKSNITDAILFVLGPKSSKAMRAGKLTDLIFDGGKSKNRASFTKVSLVFDNTDRILPRNEDVVRLTRLVKLAANEEDYSSHFFINDQRSSMSEFDNLLSRARISADGYNLVQQGDVTRIVQMGSIERRRILDGISGISSYDNDISKSEAERAEAQTDLDRISIIKGELERQLSELEKAMDAARKYMEIQRRQKMARAQIIYRGIEDEENKIVHLQENATATSDEIRKLTEDKGALEAKIAECEQRIVQLEMEIEERAGPEYKKINNDYNAKRVDKAGIMDKQERLSDDNDELEQNISIYKEEIGDLEVEISTLRNTVNENLIAIDEKKAVKKECDDEIKRINAELSSKGGEHQRLQKDLDELAPKIDEEDLKHSEIVSDLAALDAKRSEVSRILAEAEEDVNNANFEIKDLEWKLSEIMKNEKESGANAITERLLAKQKDLEEKQKQEGELMDASSRLGAEYNKLNAEKKAEDRLRGNDAVRFVLELRDLRKISGIHGTLAELATVDKEYELAMSVAIGGKMQAVVVDDDEVAAQVITAVKKADIGRVTVLPLNKMVGGKPRGPAILASKNLEGFAIDLLDFDEEYRNAFWYALGDTLIARNMDVARANMGGVRIATMGGELIEASGAMTGGSTRQFHMKFGAATPGKIEEALSKYHAANEALKNVREDIRILNSEIRAIDSELRAAQSMTANVQGEIGKLESQIKIARDDKARKELVQADSTKAYDEIQENYKNRYAEQVACEERLASMRDKRAKIRARISEIAPIELQNALSEASAKSLDLQNAISELVDANSVTNSELSGKIYHKDQLAESVEAAVKKMEYNKEKIQKLQNDLEKIEVEIGALSKIIAEMDEAVKDLRLKKDGEVNQKHQIDKDKSECEGKIQAKEGLIQTIGVEIELARGRRDDYKRDAEGIDFEVERPLPTMEELTRTDKQCDNMLAKLGNVNLGAIEEYDAKKARYDGIQIKVGTIESRIKELTELMEKLNAEKKGLFMKTYDSIDANFKDIYSELSGGGEAYMKLDDADDPFKGGLQINAKPKNGKMLRLEALSGGEKSLTALAFIFAIQESQPSPFYVLDEVDMFLDAVNAEMVAKRVKKSASKVQFIQVSLRKVTLAQAEHLIGVARQPNGVSKVIIQPDFAEVSQYEKEAVAAEAEGNGQ